MTRSRCSISTTSGNIPRCSSESKWEPSELVVLVASYRHPLHASLILLLTPSSFAKQIYPSNFVPSPCHRWIRLLEDRGQLLRNYTQNIDTLESLAGVDKVLQCHGTCISSQLCLVSNLSRIIQDCVLPAVQGPHAWRGDRAVHHVPDDSVVSQVPQGARRGD